MTDEVLGSAPAPADTNTLAPQAPTAPNPINVQPSVENGGIKPESQSSEAPKAKPTASDAIKAAQEKLAADEAKKAQTEKSDKARGDDGKFAPKTPAPQSNEAPKVAEAKTTANTVPVADTSQSEGRVSKYEPPARFNDQGKSEWANVPENVQAEVHRSIKNLEDGLQKHREGAEKWEAIKRFDDLARHYGRQGGLQDTLRQLEEFENLMDRDKMGGLQMIARQYGINLQEAAAAILGQNPNQQVAAIHRENEQLRAEIAAMRQAQQLPDAIGQWASQPGRERFEELQQDITFFLKSMAFNTQDPMEKLAIAYDMADRFRPATANASSAQAAAPTTQTSPVAEPASPAAPRPNPAGQKSISGAPSSGNSSGGKKRILSASEALSQAMARASS